MEDTPAPMNISTLDSNPTNTDIHDNDTITDVQTVNTITDVQTINDMNAMELASVAIETDSVNNDKLTEQVLTLPRKYRPINLKNDRILQTDDSTTGNENISVSTIIIPKIPGMPHNIARKAVSYSKKENKVNQMIDLLNQPSYLKKELPSQHLRENSDNLE